jgi:tetratricopeptide (TPR) repeat protein
MMKESGYSNALRGFLMAAAQLTATTASAADSLPVATQSSPVAGDADSTNERVRALFRDGNAQMVAGDYEKAHDTLLQAWNLRQSSDIAAELGQVEFATHRFREAAEHLQWSLDHFPPVESEKVLRATRALFEQAKQVVAQLRISSKPEGVSILVDGKVAGTTPMPAPVFVEPGQHQVEARARWIQDTRLIAADPGKDYDIEFAIKQTEASSAGASTPKPEVAASQTHADPQPAPLVQSVSSDRSIVPVIVGGAVFAVGFGAGIALLASSNSSYSQAHALQRQVGPAGCVNTALTQGPCADLKSATDKGDQRQNWGAVSLVAAGAALIATPIYWFWPRNKFEGAPNRAQLRIHGSLGQRYSWLSLVGEF